MNTIGLKGFHLACCVGVAAASLCSLNASAATEDTDDTTSPDVAQTDVTSGLVLPADPALFYRVITDRYDRLSEYEDVSHVVQTTARHDEQTARTETDIACTMDRKGRLSVQTASERLASLSASSPRTSACACSARPSSINAVATLDRKTYP